MDVLPPLFTLRKFEFGLSTTVSNQVNISQNSVNRRGIILEISTRN